MTAPWMPMLMVKDMIVTEVHQIEKIDDFRTQMCDTAENLRWTRGFEDLHVAFQNVYSRWLDGYIEADNLSAIDDEIRTLSITLRALLREEIMRLQQYGEFYGIEFHFPDIFPDILKGHGVSWDFSLETPLKWTNSWDQASNEALAMWAQHSGQIEFQSPASAEPATTNPQFGVERARGNTSTTTSNAKEKNPEAVVKISTT